MRKKILLVGNMGILSNDMKDVLLPYFDVQMCNADVIMLRGMLRTYSPDMVVINLVGLVTVDNMFMALKTNPDRLPVLCVRRADDLSKADDFIDGNLITEYRSDYMDKGLVRSVCRSLGINYTDLLSNVGLSGDGRKTILLIDDSSLFLRHGKTILEDRYNVLLATSAEKGNLILCKEKVDLILLDYEMPTTDGKTMFLKLKDSEKFKNIPVIFLTGVADRAHIHDVLALQPAGYILKPVEKDDLLKRIQAVFQENMAKRE